MVASADGNCIGLSKAISRPVSIDSIGDLPTGSASFTSRLSQSIRDRNSRSRVCGLTDSSVKEQGTQATWHCSQDPSAVREHRFLCWRQRRHAGIEDRRPFAIVGLPCRAILSGFELFRWTRNRCTAPSMVVDGKGHRGDSAIINQRSTSFLPQTGNIHRCRTALYIQKDIKDSSKWLLEIASLIQKQSHHGIRNRSAGSLPHRDPL